MTTTENVLLFMGAVLLLAGACLQLAGAWDWYDGRVNDLVSAYSQLQGEMPPRWRPRARDSYRQQLHDVVTGRERAELNRTRLTVRAWALVLLGTYFTALGTGQASGLVGADNWSGVGLSLGLVAVSAVIVRWGTAPRVRVPTRCEVSDRSPLDRETGR